MISRNILRRVVLVLACAAAAAGASGESYAQAGGKAGRARGARSSGKPAAGQVKPAAAPPAADPAKLVNASGALPVRNAAAPREQIWSGDAHVVMSGNDNPIVRVYLALGGSCTVEFPARDPYFVIHPPQPKPAYVIVDDSPTKKTDRYFIFRPGEDFAVPPDGVQPKPIATINVQMRSGLFVTFLVYPTVDLSLNAHRVLMKYDPNEVIAARRAAGLAVYLGDEAEQKPAGVATPIRNDEGQPAAPGADDRGKGLRDFAVVARGELNRFSGILVQPGAKEVAGLGGFGKEVNGLRVAAADTRQISGNVRVAIVAVQNRRDRTLRLAQEQPVLMVDTGKSGKPGESRLVKVLYYETTAAGGSVAAKGTVYYALVYELPTALGSAQAVRASVSEDRAVDRLASVEVARN